MAREETSRGTEQPLSPDFTAFHKSIAKELHAVKDRVRSFVHHWPTDGAFKEAALRVVLRRHLPPNVVLGTGFIAADGYASTQIDILVLDGSRPVLFQDGDLFVVTPDCVRAAIEVKSKVTVPDIEEAANKLATISKGCARLGVRIWTGIFSFESEIPLRRHSDVLQALAAASGEPVSGGLLNCVCFGEGFARLWEFGEQTGPNGHKPFWRAYKLDELAASYFVGNIALSLAGREGLHQPAWFAAPGGKELSRSVDLAVPRP